MHTPAGPTPRETLSDSPDFATEDGLRFTFTRKRTWVTPNWFWDSNPLVARVIPRIDDVAINS